MLTPAQYKALKAWPDDILLWQSSHGEEWSFLGKEFDNNCIQAFSKTGLVCITQFNTKRFHAFCKKVQPACNEAIREYEAAQNPSSQTNPGDTPETISKESK